MRAAVKSSPRTRPSTGVTPAAWTPAPLASTTRPSPRTFIGAAAPTESAEDRGDQKHPDGKAEEDR